MTQPSEEEVRAGLVTLAHTHPALGMLAVEALGLLDAGRKDRERVDWIEAQNRAVEIGPWEWSPVYDTISLRAAIDKARGA